MKLNDKDNANISKGLDYRQYQKLTRKIKRGNRAKRVFKWFLVVIIIIVGIEYADSVLTSQRRRSIENANKVVENAARELEIKEANRQPIIDKYAPLYCSSHRSTRITDMPEGYPNNSGRGWTQEECRIIIDKLYSEDSREDRIEAVINKKVWVGMTVLQLIYSWGNPQDINKTVVGDYEQNQWVYPGFNFVYVQEGVVTAYQV